MNLTTRGPSIPLTLPSIPRLDVAAAQTGQSAVTVAHEWLRPVQRLRAAQRAAAQPLMLSRVPTAGEAAGATLTSLTSLSHACASLLSCIRMPACLSSERISERIRSVGTAAATPLRSGTATAASIAASWTALRQLCRRLACSCRPPAPTAHRPLCKAWRRIEGHMCALALRQYTHLTRLSCVPATLAATAASHGDTALQDF